MTFNITSSFSGYLLIALGVFIVLAIFRKMIFHELHKIVLKLVLRKKQTTETFRVKGKQIVLGSKALGNEELTGRGDSKKLDKQVLQLKLKIEREIVEQKIQDPKLRNMVVERYAKDQELYVKNKLLALENNTAFHNEINKMVGGQ